MQDFGLTEKQHKLLHDLLDDHPEVAEVYVFGSRARGNYAAVSDVDLGVRFAPGADSGALLRLGAEIEELPIIYKFDLVDIDKIKDEFKVDVERDKRLFHKNPGSGLES